MLIRCFHNILTLTHLSSSDDWYVCCNVFFGFESPFSVDRVAASGADAFLLEAALTASCDTIHKLDFIVPFDINGIVRFAIKMIASLMSDSSTGSATSNKNITKIVL